MSRTIEVGVPDWKPLEAVLSQEDCAAFMYMGHVGGVVLYKHCNTRMYLNIDASSGRFYRYADGDYIEIDRKQAIDHVYRTT
ncbi:MAG: hypothetical protein ABR956_19165 [Terracidiphilus sp.]|jgi:hypothetical protein